MIKTKIIKREVEEVDVVICNKCGKSCPKLPCSYDFATLSYSGEYGSSRDGNREISHICITCYEELIDSFVIPINIIPGF